MSWPYRFFTKKECAKACEPAALVETVSPRLLTALDLFRGELKSEIRFMPHRRALACLKGHSPSSYHYPLYKGEQLDRPCMAADIYFPALNLLEAFFQASRFPHFGAIGIYPFWNPDPGLHVDVRLGTMRAYWWRDFSGEYYWLHSAKEIRELLPILVKAK